MRRRRILIGAFVAVLFVAVAITALMTRNPDPPDTSAVRATTPALSPRTVPATSPMPAPAIPTTPPPRSWAGNGVFSVGPKPSGGAKAAIPAGRYLVELASGGTYGYWVRCSALPCSLTSETVIEIGNADGIGFSTVVDVQPTDGGVYLYGVRFTEAG
ncbi:hypothetical protein [Nocardia wallacei]|uniref:hypothetical protein n=1 Tax=Nocardia wallacei TaxID=480035 RepID=UPI002456CA09|nr:hypothetical protein [Nocardia wallacei]